MSWEDTIEDDGPAAPKKASWEDTIQDEDEHAQAGEPKAFEGGKIVDHSTMTDAPSAAIMGIANSTGFADEGAGALEAVGSLAGVRGLGGSFGDIRHATPEEDKQSFGDVYRQGRDSKRSVYKKAAEDQPLAFSSGEIGGGAALTRGLGSGKGASLAKEIGTGSALGAVAGAGHSTGDLTKGEWEKVLLDTYLGNMISGTAGAVAKGAAAGLRGAGNKLSNFADERTIKALEPTLNQQELLNNKGVAKDLAKELRESGVVQFGSGVKDMAPRLSELLGKKGQQIGAIREGVDDALTAAGRPNTAVDMSRLRNVGDAKVAFSDATNEGTQAAADAYARNANSLAKVPRRSVGETQGEIQSLSEQIPFNKPYAERTASQQGMTDLRRDLVGQVDDKVAEVSPDKAALYQKLKEQFGLFKNAEPILDKAVARQSRNRDVGITDYQAGGLIGGEGGGLKRAAMMGLNKLAREHGNSALAVGSDKMSKLIESKLVSGGLGQFTDVMRSAVNRGGAAVEATHSLLMRNPEYRKLIEGAE